MSKPKIVDLVPAEDGSYAPKGSIVPAKSKNKKKYDYKNEKQPKYTVNKEADEFLAGIDVGLDLVDKFVPRLERFLKMRG